MRAVAPWGTPSKDPPLPAGPRELVSCHPLELAGLPPHDARAERRVAAALRQRQAVERGDLAPQPGAEVLVPVALGLVEAEARAPSTPCRGRQEYFKLGFKV